MKLMTVKGGVTAAKGFTASAVPAGIKKGRNDLTLLYSEAPAATAGVFTTNKVTAAPVKLCRSQVAKYCRAQAVIVNAGCANACTGPQGLRDAHRTASLTAHELGVPKTMVLVCSTGTIGIPLPLRKIAAAIPAVVAGLSRKGGAAAAKAIMTTDTVDKQAAVRIRAGGAAVTVGGMAKGAGMIHPNMATLLAFLTSDAAVRAADLQLCLREAVNQSFNCICVDNDQSTNDTVLLLANGRAENETLHRNHRDWPVFCAALNTVTRTLALKIVADGEGATKMVIVTVSGAASDADAEKAARAICNSMLVKTSWFGEDPNWGRVIDAVGYSGARMKEDRVGIAYDGVETVRHGRAASGASAQSLKRILAKKSFTLSVRLNIGRASCTMYTCDLSHGYVTINGSYMT